MIIVNIIHSICIGKNLLQKLTVKTQKVWNFSKPPKLKFCFAFLDESDQCFPFGREENPKNPTKKLRTVPAETLLHKGQRYFYNWCRHLFYISLTNHTPPSCMDQCLLLSIFFFLKASLNSQNGIKAVGDNFPS